jgi:hypothetical protein
MASCIPPAGTAQRHDEVVITGGVGEEFAQLIHQGRIEQARCHFSVDTSAAAASFASSRPVITTSAPSEANPA